jgi:uncharacterized membrane protein
MALRRHFKSDAGEAAIALRVVYAGAAAYAALFVFSAVLHYEVYEVARFDFGNMVQAIWSTLHGHFLETTSLGGQQRDRLGSHVDPFLLLFAPLLSVSSTPVLLPVLQAVAVASGALPVFWLARKHLDSSRAAAHFALAYLLYPATQFNAFTVQDGFHSVSFSVPLVLYAVWFLDENRRVAFSAVALLACTTKEEIPLAVGCLGLWYAVRRGRRLFGLTVFGIGFALTLANFVWLIPHFAPSGVEPFAGRYRAVGGTPQGIASKLVTDPRAFVHAVATGHKALYLALLLVPFLGLWLLEPWLLLGALPDLLINLLSNNPEQSLIDYQYTAGIVPFVVAASILGSARFKGKASSISLGALAVVAAVGVYSPILSLGSDVRLLGSPLVSAKAHALSLIPDEAPVSATNQLGGYLSERRYIYEFPYVRRSHWILVDVHDSPYGSIAGIGRYVRHYESDKAWRLVFSSHGIIVLHKRLGSP